MGQGSREDAGDRVVVSDAIVFDRSSGVIYVSKPRLTPEDAVASEFARVLEESGVDYAIVAGYVAILFGRARGSDDVDFILSGIGEGGFVELCRRASEAGFSIMQGDIASEESVMSVYRSYLIRGYGVRFVYKDVILPNVKARLAGTDVHRYAIGNSIRVVVNDENVLRISPLELQIAYKLHLGSDKDLGDAVFLYTLFREAIRREELYRWCGVLGADCRVLEEG